MKMTWNGKVEIKHLLTGNDDHESVQTSMGAIADALRESAQFIGFPTQDFYKIPQGDPVFGPVDYANKLLERMYNFADYHRIWIG